jgi:hypothetical protein
MWLAMIAKIIKLCMLILNVTVLPISTVIIFAQVVEANVTVCYMETSQGQFVDLSFLCGRKSQPISSPINYEPAFVKDLNQAISGYPEEKEVLSKINPKKFVNEARNICEKLRDGTFTEYRNQVIASVPDRETALDQFRAASSNSSSSEKSDRTITNISFNLSKELGTKHYCQEFND